jgi:hypothetical protein
MHPVRGLFNLNELNVGGRKQLAIELHNHRIALERIKPKAQDYHKFNKSIRPRTAPKHVPYTEQEPKKFHGSASLFFRRIPNANLNHYEPLLYRDPLNIPTQKKYEEKDFSQMLQNYCRKADPYGHKDSTYKL